MAHNPLIFHQQPHIDSLHLLQYNTAYFNPYEVKHRKRTSRAQLTVLEATFQQNNKPSSAVKKSLAAQLDMPIRNVQVWFQNRRAKDKNIALKARLKAEQVAAGGGITISGGDEDSGSENDDTDDGKAPKTPTTSSDSPSASLLTPPATNALRRGSAPNLGVPSLPTTTTTMAGARTSSSPTNTRSASDSVSSSSYGTRMPSLEVPTAAMLGRRKSLPAFHPALQKQYGTAGSHLPSLPTVSDGPLAGDVDSGHGGVYRSMSSGRLAVNPYPVAASTRSSQNFNYRPGSTPGTGVFRIPANPNPPAPPPLPSAWGGSQGTDESVGAAAAPSGLTTSRPFAFPPRPYSDIPNTGPLPSKDFRFGDSSGGNNNNVTSSPFRDSPPTVTTEEEDERSRAPGLVQTHRFSSFASDLSVESDATGTTATTATSSTGFSPMNNMALSAAQAMAAATSGPMMPFRPRHSFAVGMNPAYGHANTDMGIGSSISYGMGSNAMGGMGLGQSSRIQYPNKFDPESRRASCPAHFIEDMALLNVDRPTSQLVDSSNSLGVSAPFGSSGIRRSSSGIGLGRSPLSMRVQVPENGYPGQESYQETPEETETEPMTAVAGEYANIFPTNYALDANSSSSTTSGDTSRQATTSPQIRFNGFSTGASTPSTSSYQNEQGQQSSPLDGPATTSRNGGSSLPMFMSNFTQEPAYGLSDSFTYGLGSHPGSETHLPFSNQQYDSSASYAGDGQSSSFSNTSDASVTYGSYNHSNHFDSGAYQTGGPVKQEHQHSGGDARSQSFTSFLHAPAPVVPASTSSLAGAMHSNGIGSDISSFQW